MGNGIGDFFRQKTVAGLHIAYQLTPTGKRKAETYAANTPWAEVLSYLNETDSATINEIARELKQSPKKTRLIITNMSQSGYVMKVAGG